MTKKRLRINLVIFDFDGTLAKTKGLYWSSLHEAFRREGYNFSKNYLKRFLGMRLDVIMKKLDISQEESNRLQKRINGKVRRNANKLNACPFLETVNKIPAKKVLVTNSLLGFVRPFLNKHKLVFEEIVGGDKMTDKEKTFRAFFRKYKVKPKEALYVADRAQDAKIASATGCVSAILDNHYSWDSLDEIKKSKPDFIIKNLKDLGKIL